MAFQIGDVVIKPSLGICRIRNRATMTVDGTPQEFYVIHSGDVRVLVPVGQADKGSLRHLMSEKALKKVVDALQEPLRLPTDVHGDTLAEAYIIDIPKSNETIKDRDPLKLCELVRLLFNKSKDYQQLEEKAEANLLTEAMSLLSEEMAYLEKSTKGRMSTKIREMLTEARKKKKKESQSGKD